MQSWTETQFCCMDHHIVSSFELSFTFFLFVHVLFSHVHLRDHDRVLDLDLADLSLSLCLGPFHASPARHNSKFKVIQSLLLDLLKIRLFFTIKFCFYLFTFISWALWDRKCDHMISIKRRSYCLCRSVERVCYCLHTSEWESESTPSC